MANAEKKEYKLNIKLVGDGSVKKKKAEKNISLKI